MFGPAALGQVTIHEPGSMTAYAAQVGKFRSTGRRDR